ncbi:MAG: hypothetical protein WBD61_06185 [Desulfobulbales bacterium]
MNITEINPYALFDRFPSHRETIKHLFKRDKTFQTLCSDYQKCSKALHHWNKSDVREASQRREEYEALLSELESEILLILNNDNNNDTDEAHKH